MAAATDALEPLGPSLPLPSQDGPQRLDAMLLAAAAHLAALSATANNSLLLSKAALEAMATVRKGAPITTKHVGDALLLQLAYDSPKPLQEAMWNDARITSSILDGMPWGTDVCPLEGPGAFVTVARTADAVVWASAAALLAHDAALQDARAAEGLSSTRASATALHALQGTPPTPFAVMLGAPAARELVRAAASGASLAEQTALAEVVHTVLHRLVGTSEAADAPPDAPHGLPLPSYLCLVHHAEKQFPPLARLEEVPARRWRSWSSADSAHAEDDTIV